MAYFQRIVLFFTIVLAIVAASPGNAVAQTYRWDGTGPWCNGTCGSNETEITRSDVSPGSPPAYNGPPFGAPCTVGTKALCQSTPGRSCRWDGTAPACEGSCRSDETPSTPPLNSNSGAACWTGDKVYCCKKEDVATTTGQPLLLVVPPTLRYDAVWQKSKPEQTWVRGWTLADYNKKRNEMNSKGWRIVTQQAYDIGSNQIRYDAVWKQGGSAQAYVLGWAPDDFTKKWEQMYSQGWRVLTQQAYDIGGGKIRYDAVWQKGGPDQTWLRGWATEHYDRKWREMNSQGWRIVTQQAYDIGGGKIRYDSVWKRGGPDQDHVQGWAVGVYAIKWNEMNSQGWRVLTQQAYTIDGVIRYDAVWQKGGPEQQWIRGWAPEHYDGKWREMNSQGWRIVLQQIYNIN